MTRLPSRRAGFAEAEGEVLDVGGAGGIRVGQAGGRLEPLVGHQGDDLLDEGHR